MVISLVCWFSYNQFCAARHLQSSLLSVFSGDVGRAGASFEFWRPLAIFRLYRAYWARAFGKITLFYLYFSRLLVCFPNRFLIYLSLLCHLFFLFFSVHFFNCIPCVLAVCFLFGSFVVIAFVFLNCLPVE